MDSSNIQYVARLRHLRSRCILTSLVLVRGVEYARCMGTRQSATMENAAQQTLNALYTDRAGRYY